MDNFVVSARKYRPGTFNTVVGQSHITNTLKNAIRNNQLAQAFLFTGPRGVGKTTCARILAKTINCMNLDETLEPCNACESCESFNRNASFNIHELDAASNNSVDDIRTLVDQVRIPPQVGKYKVYIIDEVHMLSQQAFNAFLKTLEEPPAYAKFILATTEKHKIIPTILSRCQIYDFKRIGVNDIAELLAYVAGKENISAEPEALQIIAQKADGALRDALSIFDQLVSFTGKDLKYRHVVDNLNVLDYDYYFTITDYLYSGQLFDALVVLDKVLESGFDGQHFLTGLGSHLRDLLVCSDAKTINLLETGEKIKVRYHEQAQKTATLFLLKALDIIQKTDFTYKSSNNKRLHLEIALMQIARLNAQTEIGIPASAAAIQPLKKKTIAETPTPINQPGEAAQAHTLAKKTSPEPVPSESTPPKQPVIPVSKTPTPRAVQPQQSAKDIAEAKPKPAAKPSKTGFMPGAISIKDDISEEQEDELKKEVFDENSEAFRNTPKIDVENLEAVWREIVEDMPTDELEMRSTLLAFIPRVTDKFVLQFEVQNPIQKKKLDEFKAEILPVMRKKLNNNFITLEIVVNASDIVSTKPVSPLEKFNFLAKKNPALLDLQKKFSLEPKY